MNIAATTTDKLSPRILASLLPQYGVTDAVLCPGSRNAPLNVAVGRTPGLTVHTAVDERAAAFMAMGMSLASGRAVVMCCTSGSALLDASAAVAEAYYRHVPLIVVSADRPRRWIDQDDSQTIRQPGALAAVVKRTVDIAETDDPAYAERLINDALTAATDGPVHINLQIDAPLDGQVPADTPLTVGRIHTLAPAETAQSLAATPAISALADELAAEPSLLIYIGGLNSAFEPIPQLEAVLHTLALSGVEVVAEFQSGLRGPLLHRTIAAAPAAVVSFGGAPVCVGAKRLLRQKPPRLHVRLSTTDRDGYVDTYECLTHLVDSHPLPFLELVARRRRQFPPVAPQPLPAGGEWGEPFAVSRLIEAAEGMDLHLSKGTVIRWAQRCAVPSGTRVFCNRGVSGIDGCTSTAVGSAAVSGRATLLITGDMSFLYDIGALMLPGIPSTMRVAVIDNGGGGIFRLAASTRQLPERDAMFCAPGGKMPEAAAVARAFGWDAVEVTGSEQLDALLSGGWMHNNGAGPCVMIVKCGSEPSRYEFL